MFLSVAIRAGIPLVLATAVIAAVAVGVAAWVGRAAAHEIGGVRTSIPCAAGRTGEGAGF